MPRIKSAAADAAISKKARTAVRRPEPLTEEEFMDLLEQDIKGDDTTTLGHYLLQWEREHLRYLRLIEHEMPKLVGESFCIDFIRASRSHLGNAQPFENRSSLQLPASLL
jgi:hypothetical protein